ncbi:MAG: gliding motility-associated C-terminal domain-containing protein, partial [Cyclobacteriaceae bacterium]
FNGDGHVDMAATTTTQTIWMENDGAGNFSERIINLSVGNNDLHAADIDGDGDMDLIGGNLGFRFFENDGAGNFTIRSTSGSTSIEDVFAADVDSDGDMDVITGGQGSVVAWFENTVPPNSPPSLSSTSSSITYAGSPIVVDAAIAVTDSDSPNLASATIQITPSTFVSTEDVLVYTDQNGISGSYNSTNGTLSLSGSASLINYRTALRSIRYQNTSNTPNPTSRVVEFLVNDGSANSNIKISTINFSSGNQPPVFSPNTLSTVVNGSVNLTLSTIVSDPDGNLDPSTFSIVQQPISGAIATISGGVLTLDYSNTTFAGQDNLIIEVFDLAGARAEATIFIQVDGNLIFYNGISPNGDDLNAYFRIQNIESLQPENIVSIYNRWGDKVFEVQNYNNDNPEKRFNGTSDDGKDLPSGVYFYKIEFGSGSPELSGYLTLKR